MIKKGIILAGGMGTRIKDVEENVPKPMLKIGKYPIISLTPMKNPTIDTVSFDSYSGGYMIAKHFEEQGYKNFGIVSGPSDAVDAVFRKNGFVDHISEKNNLNLIWEYKGDFLPIQPEYSILVL